MLFEFFRIVDVAGTGLFCPVGHARDFAFFGFDFWCLYVGVVIAAVVFVCVAIVVVVSLYLLHGVRGHADLPATGKSVGPKSPIAEWDNFSIGSSMESQNPGVQRNLMPQDLDPSTQKTQS